ncbi:hypothetical protein SAMN05216603_11528 [Pseudomonas benzenivorans]|nr:PAS domain S-box protein [Pseudomonas benzenivorans]SDH85493.1 hypothetical protein SAMN05216603_11528 [Pseudomonas benzenivorans]
MSARLVAQQAYLYTVAFALLAIGGISLLGYLQLAQPSRHAVVLLPDAALAALLLGLCLLATLRGWRGLCLTAAGALLALCGYSLLHNLWAGDADQGASLLSGFLRMRSALALIHILLALAMLGSLQGPLGKGFSRAIGLGVVAFGLIEQLAQRLPILEATLLGFKPEATSIASLFALSLGTAILLLPSQRAESAQTLDTPSLAAGALAVLLTCLAWYLLNLQNAESQTRQSEQLLSQARISVERALEERLALIQRMAERWEVVGTQPSQELWQQEAGSYLRDVPDLQLLGLLDETLQPHRVQARRAEESRWLEEFLATPSQRERLRQLQREGLADISQVVQHQGGEAAMLIAVPLRLPGQPTWLLVAELNIPSMLAPLLDNRQNRFLLRLFEGERQVFGPPPGLTADARTPIGELQAQLPHGVEWRLSSYPGDPQLRYAAAYLPALVLLFGQVLSFFLMLSQRLARLAIERSDHLHQANHELESSLQRQAQLQALNQRIMQCSLDVLCSIDAEGRFSQVSPSSRAVFGYRPEEMIGRPYVDFVWPEDRAQAAAELQAIIAGHVNQTLRHCCRRQDGSSVYILWSAAWSASDRSLFAVAHDITPIVRNEAYAEDQRDILSMVSTDQPLERILTAICQMTEAQEPTALCVVMLVDEQQHNLYLGAGPSLPDGYGETLKHVSIGPTAGSCGTAVHQRRMVIAEDIASDPLWRDYRVALEYDLHACWSIPLISHKGEVLGSLAIYHRQPTSPDDEQLQLIATAGQLAAIAIARQHDRLRLQESEQRYRSLFTFNPNPVFSLDLSGRYLSMNQAGCELSGYAEEELLGNNFSMLVLGEEIARVRQYFQAARQGEPQHFEAKCRNRQGEELELEVTNLPIKVEGQIVGVFGIAKDISERNRMTRALREALQHSEHQAEMLRGLNDSAVAMSGILDSQALLSFMAERMRLLIGAHQARVSLVQDIGWAQSINAMSLSEKYRAWDKTVLDEDAFYRTICDLDLPLLLTQPELQAHPRWHGLCAESAQQPPLCGWLAVPLKNQAGDKLGLLQLSDKYQGEFDRDDLAVAQQFAQMAVAVLEKNRLMHAVMAGEQRLKAQLGFTSAITQSTAEGLLAVGSQGLLTFVNPAAARLIGQPADELLGQPLAECLPLPLGDWPLDSGEPDDRHGEFRLPGDGLEPLYMAFDSAPLLDGNGANGWVVAIRDISAQRLADQAMRERDQFFTLSLEMFCMLGLDGNFLQVNTAFLEVLGYPLECLVGCPYLELIHPEDRPLLVEKLRQLLAGEALLDLELRVLDAQGEPHWLQLSAALGDDRVIYCAARDISARKAAEQALQDSLRELERSNRELQEFAFVASHDLQEPLRKIQAFAERLQARAGDLDEEGQDYLQRMSSAAGRMQALIRDLLAYSRVTSRGQPFQRLSLEQLLDEVLQDLETTRESSGAQVVREALPELDGDPTQMRQLLQNLLSNAIKFHREGEPARIRVYAERQEPDEWILCVADQGIGFDEKYLDRIFNPFQRLHGRQAYPGTGIGLAIVKKIVERHGARITASSRPGAGSTFRITFKMPV